MRYCSSRNSFVAETLNDAGLVALLFDLLTSKEDEVARVTREMRFDIGLSSDRMSGAVDWPDYRVPNASL